jgi:predicted amidohydrolase
MARSATTGRRICRCSASTDSCKRETPGNRRSSRLRSAASGLSICYDIRFPESARSLALAGADLIAHSANWPSEAAILAEHFVAVRACENRVFFAAANRGDAENGTSFAGGSRVAGIDGEVLCAAERDEDLLLAEVDLSKAREKLIVRRPGAFETDLFGDRRPELYGALTSKEEP